MVWLRQLLKDFATDVGRTLDDRNSVAGPLTLWIPGDPATFATRREGEWKAVLASTIPRSRGEQVAGLNMDFLVRNLAPGGHPLDVDNLCEPVFSVLVNQLGWFGGKRQNIRWWCARKARNGQSGLRLTLVGSAPWDVDMGELVLKPALDGVYTGALPRSATDPVFARWVREQPGLRTGGAEYAVLFRFAETKVNLGDVATGPIKALLDGLYPLLGGEAGRPEDWRIRTLAVEKGVRDVPSRGLALRVWEVPNGTEKAPFSEPHPHEHPTIGDEGGYRELRSMSQGYIYNDFSGLSPSGKQYNVLHKANCGYLARSNTTVAKLHFDSLDDAINWLRKNRGREGHGWRFCDRCWPIG